MENRYYKISAEDENAVTDNIKAYLTGGFVPDPFSENPHE
jgi:hypothetical protein